MRQAKEKKTEKKVGAFYVVSTDKTENPKLIAKVLKSGMDSLLLEYNLGYEMVYDAQKDKMKPMQKKQRVALSLYIHGEVGRDAVKKEHNRQTIELAKRIRWERQQEMAEQETGYRVPKKKTDADFLAFFREYIDKYTKADIKVIRMALRRFETFLEETDEYKRYSKKIDPKHIDGEMVEAFCEYLQSVSRGSGANSVFKRWKKVFKAMAAKHNFSYEKAMTDEQGQRICIREDDSALTKDVLSPEEIRQLAATHYPEQNLQVRNAFFFCLNTGLRFCDVSALSWDDVDASNGTITFEQAKTKGHSSKSKVTIQINDTLRELMGNPKKGALVFSLPSHTACLKALRYWTKKAGIEKHITWHCARHSFGTNMALVSAQKGYGIRLVQEAMGHSKLTYTEKYTRVYDRQRKEAQDALSELLGV